MPPKLYFFSCSVSKSHPNTRARKQSRAAAFVFKGSSSFLARLNYRSGFWKRGTRTITFREGAAAYGLWQKK
tara:strand:- start:216 stop:431 length:216 start_codon:yes stop_codon:yes gene_type:complete